MGLSRRGFVKGVAGLFVAAGAGELFVPEPKIWALGAMPGTDAGYPPHGQAPRLIADWAEYLHPDDTPFTTMLLPEPSHFEVGDVLYTGNEIVWVSGVDAGQIQVVRGWGNG